MPQGVTPILQEVGVALQTQQQWRPPDRVLELDQTLGLFYTEASNCSLPHCHMPGAISN